MCLFLSENHITCDLQGRQSKSEKHKIHTRSKKSGRAKEERERKRRREKRGKEEERKRGRERERKKERIVHAYHDGQEGHNNFPHDTQKQCVTEKQSSWKLEFIPL
jgi:hypothetical protein